ncbi:MAG: TRAM domain-containing protein [Acidobacteria bacterium]|nr:TRAM domain-containing protein [Acidobacteriota bacterium]
MATSTDESIAAGVLSGTTHEVTIEKLVYGGDGLARIGHQAVFVPFAAPGDRARIRIV